MTALDDNARKILRDSYARNVARMVAMKAAPVCDDLDALHIASAISMALTRILRKRIGRAVA